MPNIFVSLYRWFKKPPKNREGLFLRTLSWSWMSLFFLPVLTTALNCSYFKPAKEQAIDGFYLYNIVVALFFPFMLFPIFVISKKMILKIIFGLFAIAGFLGPIVFIISMYQEFFHDIPLAHKTRFILQILFDLAILITYVFIVVRKANKFNAATVPPIIPSS